MKYALVMYTKDGRRLKPSIYDLGTCSFCKKLTEESLADSRSELSAVRRDFSGIATGLHIIALPELNPEALDYIVSEWIPTDRVAPISLVEAATRVTDEIKRLKAAIVRFGERLDLSNLSIRQQEFFKLLSRSAIDEIADRLV